MPSAFAQTVTGTIQGTITSSSQANTKLAGVAVAAVAPSGRYVATTDQNGFFTMQGVSSDTYSVTFTRTGYETFTLSGVTVTQGQIANVSAALNQSLTRIGRTQARSTAGAFQPGQTTDQYNVGAAQITTQLGKSGNPNESDLLASIPGASFDSSGYPVLRGGREYEEGFQFEGIDYTDAFTHQFTNSLILNGAQNFQVQPGAGDASVGNAGTGAINVVAKRGTNPHFGQLEAGLWSGTYEHDARGEYGWASPNGRYSEYASVYADRIAPQYGQTGQSILNENCFFGCTSTEFDQDVLNNFVYKFGKDNNQSFQFFYQNTSLYAHLGLGIPPQGLPFRDNDPLQVTTLAGATGFSNAQIQSLLPFTLGQQGLTQRYGGSQSIRQNFNYNQPAETFKLQYSINFNATTYLTAKFYRVDAVELFDIPEASNTTFFQDQVSLQGGQRAGFALDGTKQLGSKNLLGFGGKYDFLRPVYSQPSATNSCLAFCGFGAGQEAADFLPGGYITGYMPGRSLGNALNVGQTGAACPVNGTSAAPHITGLGTNNCAPLPASVQLPYSDESTATNRQDCALYVKDTFSPTDRLKFDFGLRLDGVNWLRPAATSTFACRRARTPTPRATRSIPCSTTTRTRSARACCSPASRCRGRRRATTRSASATGVRCSSLRSRAPTSPARGRRTRCSTTSRPSTTDSTRTAPRVPPRGTAASPAISSARATRINCTGTTRTPYLACRFNP